MKTRDLVLLYPSAWLNDMIINSYTLMLSQKSFELATEQFGLDTLFQSNFLCLNTFLTVKILELKKNYEDYQAIKSLVESEENFRGDDQGSFESDEEDEEEEERERMIKEKQKMLDQAKKGYSK